MRVRPVRLLPAESRNTAVSWLVAPSSTLITEGVMVTVATPTGSLRNPAATVRACDITTVQLPVPAHEPPHASSVLPALAVAVSVTLVPAANEPVQLPVVQLIPAGDDVTDPVPSPETVTVSVCAGGATVMVADPD